MTATRCTLATALPPPYPAAVDVRSPSAAAPTRPSSTSACSSASGSIRSPDAETVADREHRRGGDAVPGGDREHGAGREVERDRAAAGARRVVVEVGRDHQPDRGAVAGGAQAGEQTRVGRQLALRAERPAGPVPHADRLGDHQRAERQVGERAAAPDPDQPSRAERDQLLGDDRRARAAEAGALDGQRRAVGGRPGVAPEAAMVVEHLRPVEQLLGQSQRPAGISRQEHALGNGLVRAKMDRACHRWGD